MSETHSGIRSILSHPQIYNLWQKLLGGTSGRKAIVDNYIRPTMDMRMLDIGCGTAQILEYLPEGIDYIGFDASREYIESARQRYPNRGNFYQELVTTATLNDLGEFDLVFASGLLHHLEDDEVRKLSELAFHALRPGGRLLTIDPAYQKGQSPVARFLISRDRGQNVRHTEKYEQLLLEQTKWSSISHDLRHDLLHFPYTHAIIECHK